jgi:hypothetical protein
MNNHIGKHLTTYLLSSSINDSEQLISQILRLVTQSPEFANYLLLNGLISKIIQTFNNNPNTQTLMKLLKIVLVWTDTSLWDLYWCSHQQQLFDLRRCINGRQSSVSVLVSGLASQIELKISVLDNNVKYKV